MWQDGEVDWWFTFEVPEQRSREMKAQILAAVAREPDRWCARLTNHIVWPVDRPKWMRVTAGEVCDGLEIKALEATRAAGEYQFVFAPREGTVYLHIS